MFRRYRRNWISSSAEENYDDYIDRFLREELARSEEEFANKLLTDPKLKNILIDVASDEMNKLYKKGCTCPLDLKAEIAMLAEQHLPYCPAHEAGKNRRNPDINLRQLERAFAATPTQELAERLMSVYQRVGRELEYLQLLNQYGPILRQHGRYVTGSSGYQKLIYPRLTSEQEQRYQQLMWHDLVARAQLADKTGTIDFDLLREAESFVDRGVHNRWDYNLLVDITKPDGTVEEHPYKDTDDIRWYDDDDEILAKMYCRRDDEGVELMTKAEYIKYWKDYPDHPVEEPWENVTEPELGYVGGGNLTAIGFLYNHRNCAYDHRDDIDPFDPSFDLPPDTPSLPPRGSADPNW